VFPLRSVCADSQRHAKIDARYPVARASPRTARAIRENPYSHKVTMKCEPSKGGAPIEHDIKGRGTDLDEIAPGVPNAPPRSGVVAAH